MKYAVLLRGINVGGNNKVPMAELKKCLGDAGFSDVSTYIASGNVLLASAKPADEVRAQIEELLPQHFSLKGERVKVLVLSFAELQAIVDSKPKGLGEQPTKYHSDVVFLMDGNEQEALSVFKPKEGVDTVWSGNRVIYSQRLSALRTKSNLSKIVGTSAYQSMTIRTWNTVQKLFKLLQSSS